MNDLTRDLLTALAFGSCLFILGLIALSAHAVYEANLEVEQPCMRDEFGRVRDCE